MTTDDFIDPEHQGADRELLRTFYKACHADGGTADEITLRGIRAVLALAAADKPAAVAPEAPRRPRYTRHYADGSWQGADHPGGPWRSIPTPRIDLPPYVRHLPDGCWLSTDGPAVPESREPAAAPAAPTIEGVGEGKSGCARIELVTAIYCLASHFEIACSDLSGDDLQKARNDIAHARCIAAKHNQSGPGCPQFPPACWDRTSAPAAPAAGQRQTLSSVEELHERYRSAAGEYPDPDGLAAAIRALADHVIDERCQNESERRIYDRIRRVAAELEGADA